MRYTIWTIFDKNEVPNYYVIDCKTKKKSIKTNNLSVAMVACARLNGKHFSEDLKDFKRRLEQDPA